MATAAVDMEKINWQAIALRFMHPTQVDIINHLQKIDPLPASPVEMSRALDEPLGNVSYHVKVLAEMKDPPLLMLVAEKKVRGALEHFYRLADLT